MTRQGGVTISGGALTQSSVVLAARNPAAGLEEVQDVLQGLAVFQANRFFSIVFVQVHLYNRSAVTLSGKVPRSGHRLFLF